MEQTSHQKKFFFLCGGILLLLVLSYSLSFKKALSEREKYSALQEKAASISNLDTDLLRWKAANATLDEQLGSDALEGGFQESLLHETGLFCSAHDLTLQEFSEPFEGKDGDFSVETIVLNIEGDFKSLLRLVHHLEENFRGGKIASAGFFREKNFKTNREELFLRLYVQKIKKNEDEQA